MDLHQRKYKSWVSVQEGDLVISGDDAGLSRTAEMIYDEILAQQLMERCGDRYSGDHINLIAIDISIQVAHQVEVGSPIILNFGDIQHSN
tara:strand:+ start:207 stop:476 length:270 start_codon:yes stop_codon:yes gene_type:complete